MNYILPTHNTLPIPNDLINAKTNEIISPCSIHPSISVGFNKYVVEAKRRLAELDPILHSRVNHILNISFFISPTIPAQYLELTEIINIYKINHLNPIYLVHKHDITQDYHVDISNIPYNISNTNTFIFADCCPISPDYSQLNLMMMSTAFIINTQGLHENSVFKVSHITTISEIDIIFILCYLYKNIYIYKPSISDPISEHRYIVCVDFIRNGNNLMNIYRNLRNKIDSNSSKIISNLVPIHIINKLNESNIVVAQQQLDAIEQTAQLCGNEVKLSTLSKTIGQRTSHWIKRNIF